MFGNCETVVRTARGRRRRGGEEVHRLRHRTFPKNGTVGEKWLMESLKLFYEGVRE